MLFFFQQKKNLKIKLKYFSNSKLISLNMNYSKQQDIMFNIKLIKNILFQFTKTCSCFSYFILSIKFNF